MPTRPPLFGDGCPPMAPMPPRPVRGIYRHPSPAFDGEGVNYSPAMMVPALRGAASLVSPIPLAMIAKSGIAEGIASSESQGFRYLMACLRVGNVVAFWWLLDGCLTLFGTFVLELAEDLNVFQRNMPPATLTLNSVNGQLRKITVMHNLHHFSTVFATPLVPKPQKVSLSAAYQKSDGLCLSGSEMGNVMVVQKEDVASPN